MFFCINMFGLLDLDRKLNEYLIGFKNCLIFFWFLIIYIFDKKDWNICQRSKIYFLFYLYVCVEIIRVLNKINFVIFKEIIYNCVI